MWKTIRNMGIEGEKDDELFEGMIRDMESGDRNICEAKLGEAIRIP